MNRSELIHRGWHERSIYATDASMYREVPSGIAAPRDGEELQRIVAETAKHNEPILARGAGSSLAGQTVGHGVVLDFSRHMHRLSVWTPTANRRGCSQDWSWMNSTAKRRPTDSSLALMFPPAPMPLWAA